MKMSRTSDLVASVYAAVLCVIPCSLSAQEHPESPVRIEVHTDRPAGTLDPIWNYFGYDEPNYTYAPNGQKLLGEIAALSSTPAYVRVHNLLTSGDGSSSLKWGSTNAYTEAADGNPVYSWVILDRIFDTFQAKGVKPLVEIGFMPEALSTHPEPYRHRFPEGSIFTGWAYPPKDYAKWAELVFQFVRHLRSRYGDAEVKSWLWEVWNEPDIPYWKGTREEYFKLYDYTVDAVRRALPDALVGGPDTTGPAAEKAADFLRAFLVHCSREQNFATGATGSPLNFISYHPKGSPAWSGDHVTMGLARQLASIDRGFEIVASFPEWRNTPVVLGESDPEGCAGCSPRKDPQYGYRNRPVYAAYTAETLKEIRAVAAQRQIHFTGAVTWAFEFENQPYFEGFRELATNGIDKPVLNAFRMLGLLGRERVEAASSDAFPAAEVLKNGVRGKPDVDVLAGRQGREIEALVWNYHDDDVGVADALIEMTISGLPPNVKASRIEHFRIDASHSNSFAAWQAMGSPLTPTPEQYNRFEAAGQLQELGPPTKVPVRKGSVVVRFSLPREALSLIRLSW